MHRFRTDIEELNQKVLLFAVDIANVKLCGQCLGAHPKVVRRLKQANASGCRCAITCGVPLVILRPGVVDDLATAEGFTSHRRSPRQPLPELLPEINLLALSLAQRATLTSPYLASLFFGISKRQLDVVAAACMRDLRAYAYHCDSIVKLRGASEPLLWERMMIGDCIGGPRGRGLSHDAALLGLDVAAVVEA